MKLFIVYKKKHKETGVLYSGKSSGEYTGSKTDARKILEKRDKYHHKNAKGFDKAILEQQSTDEDAVRGYEQMMIDHYGGAQSSGGTSGNQYNSISPKNKKKQQYLEAALKVFGPLLLVIAFIYLLL